MREKIGVELIDDISGCDFKELLTSAVIATIENEGISSPVEISITMVDEDEIHELNKTHREMDKPTDVLSFPLLELYMVEDKETEIVKNSVNIGYESTFLGDVVLCLDVAKRQAKEYGHSLERELAFLTVHSVLHILGYDHMNEEDESVMREKQREIMQVLGLSR